MLGKSESAPAPAVMWRNRLRAHFMTAHYAVSVDSGKLSPFSRSRLVKTIRTPDCNEAYWGAHPLMAQSGQFIRSLRRRAAQTAEGWSDPAALAVVRLTTPPHLKPSSLRRKPLFRPNCDRCCDGGGNLLNGPFVLTARNNGEAVRRGAAPGGAKTFRVELPGAGVFAARLLERFAGHLSVRRKGHFEFGSGQAYRSKGLAGEEGRTNLCRRHRLSSEGRGISEKQFGKDEQGKPQHANCPSIAARDIKTAQSRTQSKRQILRWGLPFFSHQNRMTPTTAIYKILSFMRFLPYRPV